MDVKVDATLKRVSPLRTGVPDSVLIHWSSFCNAARDITVLLVTLHYWGADAMVGIGAAAQTMAGNLRRYPPRRKAGPRPRTNSTRKHTSKAQRLCTCFSLYLAVRNTNVPIPLRVLHATSYLAASILHDIQCQHQVLKELATLWLPPGQGTFLGECAPGP